MSESQRTKDRDFYISLGKLLKKTQGLPFEEKIKIIVKEDANVLGCERVSFWKFDIKETLIVSNNIYIKSKNEFVSGLTLFEADYPNYFKSIKHENLIDASDVYSHLATKEFVDGYLIPLGISSMLDHIVKFGDKNIGVLCHEHVGVARKWSDEEILYSKMLTDMIALSLKDDAIVRGHQELHAVNIEKNKVEDISLSMQKMALIGGWELDLNTGKTMWTEGTYRIHQLPIGTPTDLINGISYYAPHEQNRIKSIVNHTILTGIPFDEELEFIDAKGEKKWVRSRGEPVYDTSGVIVALRGAFQDITKIKMKSQSLIEIQNKMKLIMETTPAAMYECLVSEKWTITFMSSYIREITGYESEDFTNQAKIYYADIIHPLDRKAVNEIFFNSVKSGKPYSFEYRIKHKNGDMRWVWERGQYNHVSDKLVGVIFDITEEKIHKENLKVISLLREKYISHDASPSEFYAPLLSMIIDHMEANSGALASIYQGQDGNIQVEKIAGEFTADQDILGQVLQTSGRILFTADGSRVFFPLFAHKKLIATLELVNSKAMGTEKLTLDYLPFLNAVGEMIEHIQTEESLKRQMSMTQHQAKLASIGELAAGVGHEINNPLAIIKGMLTLLQGKLEKQNHCDSEAKEKFYKIDMAISRIVSIVKGLRTFARSDGDELGAVNLSSVVDETYSLYKEIYEKKGLKISINDKSVNSNYTLWGNRGKIQQVLVNLISNARDAVENQEIKKIEIELFSEANFIGFVVRDSGVGVDESIKEKIFEPFFTTKPVNKGTGIGLALVQSIVREHGGKIHLDSKLGMGTSISITFPSYLENKKIA
jgi:PAS domain S-box-containing protein